MKQYFKVGLLSLFFSSLLAFFIIVLCVVVNPIAAGKFFDGIRFEGMAYASYDLAYRGSDDIEDLHTMMNKAISAGNNSDVVFYGNKLFNNSGYNVFIKNTDSENLATSYEHQYSYQYLISISSENNYLKNKYVVALLEKGLTTQARDFARAETEKVISNGFEVNLATGFFYGSFENKDIKNADLQLLETYYNKVKEQLKSKTEDAVGNVIGMDAEVKLTLQVLNLRLTQCADVFTRASIEIFENSYGGDNDLASDKTNALNAILELAKENDVIIRSNVNWF